MSAGATLLGDFMGSVRRDLHYDKKKKILGPHCHKCGEIMRKKHGRFYGRTYECDKCGEIFEEDDLP